VSMKNGSTPQTPCEIFSLGEVEDYTVIINSITSVPGSQDDFGIFSIYPNPSADFLNVRFNKNYNTTTLKIVDQLGNIIRTCHVLSNEAATLDIHDLSNGLYFLVASDMNGRTKVEKWVKGM
jgi:hypothetical protein